MPSVKQIIENSDTKAGKWFDIMIQLLIIVSIVSFSIETLPDLSDESRRALRLIEIITVIIFTLEYLLRIIVADKKRKFIFSFFGLVDLLAILPFYIATGLDLRALRAIRLLRTFRLLKLVRYSKAVQRFVIALKMIKEELTLFFFLSVILF